MIARLYRWVRARTARTLRRFKIKWTTSWLTEAAIAATLRQLPFEAPRILMVHSSLSSCGYIKGGPSTVIKALQEWNAYGTLVFPTHSYNYPDTKGDGFEFDPGRTRSVVGEITNAFLKRPGVKRSNHPTHSLACEGSESDALVLGHEYCNTPCGPGTPYERLIEMDAAVVMFGTTLDAYTLFHTAEDAAGVSYLYEPAPVLLKLRQHDGLRYMSMYRQDMSVRRRFGDVATWLEARGLLLRLPCGRSELLWIPHSKAVHEAVLEVLGRDPWFFVAQDARPNL